jgi:transcriptional regulator with XRE-family HTH domain
MSIKKYNGRDWGRIVKAVRVLRDETIRQSAKKARISIATFSRVENGKEPDVNTLFAVSKWLGVAMEKFFTKPKNN